MPPQTMSNTSNNDEQRTVFDQFCQVCTCMGVIDWYQASHCAGKTFWATLLTVCLLITGYGITISVQRLIDEPPFKTTTSQSRVQNGGVPFPNVTICNYNRVKQSIVDSTKIDPKVLVYMFNWFTTPYDLPLTLLDESQIKIYEQAWMDYVAANNGNVSIPDILRTYGHGKDMFLSTSHFRRPVTKYEEVISIYGRCWKPEISYNQRMPGSHLGVQMIIDPQFYDYLDNVSINSFLESGIIVSFTYVDEFMIPRPVSVPLGMAAKISLRLSKYTRSESQMPLRKFKCARGSTKLSMISAPYTILNCIFNCNVRAMYERCGCIFFAVTKQPYPLCNMSAVSKCKITDIYTSEQYKICDQTCEPPCQDYFVVETSTSLATYGAISDRVSKSVAAILEARGGKMDQFREEQFRNMISLDIYFDVLEINVIKTQETTSLNDFVGNLGGQLGLFVGASLLTVVQFIYYLMLWICSIRSTKISRNVNPTLTVG